MREKKKLLLVEDDETLVTSMKTALEKDGWLVAAVSCVEDALQELEGGRFDLVVTDYRLSSERDGLFLLSYLNQLPAGPPTVLVSGSWTHGLDHAAMERGAFAFLRKPFDLAVFLNTCRTALLGNNGLPGSCIRPPDP